MINNKALNKLQYHDIINQASKYCISSIARKRLEDSYPCENYLDAVTLLSESQQALKLYDLGASLDFSIDDMADIASLSKINSCLTMAQLLCVMRQLRTARLLQSTFLDNYDNVDITLLQAKASMLYSNRMIENEIDSAIISDDEMDDRASNELFDIRKKIKSTNIDIKQKLSSYTRQSNLSGYLQDSIVTIREGRYVVPVKQEYRSFVNGIVHDQSASGSTLFVEPIAIVQLNNQLRSLLADEREEIERILLSFTQRIAQFADKLIINQDVISELDVIFAKVKYGIANKCIMPELNNKGCINIVGARHPLIDSSKVVPIDAALGRDYDIVVVTGPNTGGKTVSLKTVGLISLMAMNGMFVPCRSAEVSFFNEIYCDIGDEQSIEQNLSTFSSHIVNISDILRNCNNTSLVLIDEAGAGTEPNEGTALALAITEYLRSSGAKSMVTTHYGALKEYAITAPRVENACMEFHPETFAPTYKLVIGVPGSSNAIAIASRLGMPKEVLDYALSNIDADKKTLDNILNNAEQLRQKYVHDAEMIALEKEKLQAQIDKTNKLNENLTAERNKLLANSRQEAKRIVNEAHAQANEVIDELKQMLNNQNLSEKHLFEARSKRKLLDSISTTNNEDDREENIFFGDNVEYSRIKKGDSYYCKPLSNMVVVESVSSANKVYVRAGVLATTVKASDLYIAKVESKQQSISTKKQKNTNKSLGSNNQQSKKISFRSSNSEINILGYRVDEAESALGDFIDYAVSNNYGTVWVIHGMGTGRLREGVHQYLKRNSAVASFRLGKYGEGDSGVTVVTLK